MSSPLQSRSEAKEPYEMNTDLQHDLKHVPLGEQIGHRPEDHDLNQFGYKAELEVCTSTLDLCL
jgi:hypothetical protein